MSFSGTAYQTFFGVATVIVNKPILFPTKLRISSLKELKDTFHNEGYQIAKAIERWQEGVSDLIDNVIV